MVRSVGSVPTLLHVGDTASPTPALAGAASMTSLLVGGRFITTTGIACAAGAPFAEVVGSVPPPHAAASAAAATMASRVKRWFP